MPDDTYKLVTVADICRLSGRSEARVRAILGMPGAPGACIPAQRIQHGTISGKYYLSDIQVFFSRLKAPITLSEAHPQFAEKPKKSVVFNASDFTAVNRLFTYRGKPKLSR
jgi:hypothetical protein